MKFLVGNTPTALWYEIIHDAESTCAITLKQELESYLVMLVMRYMNRPDIIQRIVATQLLQATQVGSAIREQTFQDIGDTCLLFSGLFPKIAEKRLVKISYFVRMGRSAYSLISETNNDLYGMLSEHFVPLMDVLQSVKKHSQEMLPLEAYDLWNETGSQRALSILKQYTHAFPVSIKKEQI